MYRRSAHLISVLLLASTLSAGPSAFASSAVRGDWPKFQFDQGNSGFNRFETIIGPSNVASLTQAWEQDVGGSSSPSVANGVLYEGSRAFDAATGNLLWDASVGTSFSVPAISRGVVYVATQGDLYALNAATGQVRWKGSTAGMLFSSPLVGDRLVYFQASGVLFAFPTSCSDPCSPAWTDDLGKGDSSPALINGVLYTTARNGDMTGSTLYALDPATGTVEWTAGLPGTVLTAPTVAGGAVYVGYSDPASLAAYPASCATPCQPLWTHPTGAVVRRIAAARGMVYAQVGGNNLDAFEAATGGKVWEAILDPSFQGGSGSPSVANGVVYQMGAKGTLFAFDASTGVQLFSADMSNCTPSCMGVISSIPAISNGVVYVRGADLKVHAFHLGG